MMKAGKKVQYMDQAERRRFLITELLKEQPLYGHMEIPQERIRQEQLLRSLMNIRMPGAVSQRFLEVQDAYLREEISGKGITDLEDLKPVSGNLSVAGGYHHAPV